MKKKKVNTCLQSQCQSLSQAFFQRVTFDTEISFQRPMFVPQPTWTLTNPAGFKTMNKNFD